MVGCPSRKVGYLSRSQAVSAGKNSSKKLKPYSCGDCDCWHLTSDDKASQRRMKKAIRKRKKELIERGVT